MKNNKCKRCVEARKNPEEVFKGEQVLAITTSCGRFRGKAEWIKGNTVFLTEATLDNEKCDDVIVAFNVVYPRNGWY